MGHRHQPLLSLPITKCLATTVGKSPITAMKETKGWVPTRTTTVECPERAVVPPGTTSAVNITDQLVKMFIIMMIKYKTRPTLSTITVADASGRIQMLKDPSTFTKCPMTRFIAATKINTKPKFFNPLFVTSPPPRRVKLCECTAMWNVVLVSTLHRFHQH
ncbi:unnamed protein product [Trypanosoma congolense IL3000]|uniref:WGS project CAEQ00000000 data, annotated contig 2402 n=1 Tax=Trypanosoma congolense (strain IL3000) TaxID=1068625 RepID=F9WDT1_TRYCI|nr:unnamed protein product [Trypanosoma congolense IL3000]